MKPLNRFASFLICVLLVAACASPAATIAPATAAPTTAPAVAPTLAPANTAVAGLDKGLFFTRPGGGGGPPGGYDLRPGSVRLSLPAGRLSADGRHYFATAQDGADTLVSGYDLSTGAANLQARVSG